MKPIVVDTGGLLRALARRSDGEPTWPEFEAILRGALSVIVPALVLAEVDYFLRNERAAMRTLVAEILDPHTRYELELPIPGDLARAMELDARFKGLGLGIVDGSVAAVAERRRVRRVLTTDQRHFSALRVGPRLDQALEIVPGG